MQIKRALISVFDKTNLKILAAFLHANHVEMISTGGTAQFLREHHFPVIEVSEITQFPEILEGRIKTLHPKIHGALLAKRSDKFHMQTLGNHNIQPIDLLVVNLYPFEKVAANPHCNHDELIENIDIGGPTLLRAAAKNHEDIMVLSDPNDYNLFIEQAKKNNSFSKLFKQTLAIKVFQTTASYDNTISRKLSEHFQVEPKMQSLEIHLENSYPKETLRYGENPHQKAEVYILKADPIQLAGTTPLQGKKLSYNNLLDADAAFFALRCLMDNQENALSGAVVIKHGTPCGAALDENINIALKKALASDPLSAFGGIVALSREVTENVADVLSNIFLEVVIAPSFSEKAKTILHQKQNLRLLEIKNLLSSLLPKKSFRSINGGLLVQDHDIPYVGVLQAEVVTQRAPSKQEWEDLSLAFRLSIACRSNAIAIASAKQLLSAGAGQTSRVDSVELAIQKAIKFNHFLKNASLGSDAFFPFADGIIAAAEAGITAIAQVGGSKRDAEIIQAANEYNLAMIFTHERHFRH